jgi:cytochrome c553
MSFRLGVALAALFALGTAHAEGSAAAPAMGDAKAGEAKAAACGACHGIDRNSSDKQYPKLAGQHETYIARQLALFKANQRVNPIMIAFAAPLSEQDMRDVGAFFATKKALTGVADEKLLARGEQLYKGGDVKLGVPACLACHGPDGRGNPGAGYPQLAGQWTDYANAKLKEWHDGTSWGADDRAKIMPEIARKLTEQDIAAVSSYIEGLHTATVQTAKAE